MSIRTGAMTDAQRIEALLLREKPDKVPIWPFAPGGFSVVYAKANVADAYRKPDVALAAQRKSSEDFGWVFAPFMAYASFGAWELGGEIRWPDGEFAQAPMVTRRPVETEEDVWSLKIPDIPTAGFIPNMTKFCKLASQEMLDSKPFKVCSYHGGPFSRAGNVAGLETLCKWLIKKPETAHRLLRVATEFIKGLAEYWYDIFGIERVLPLTGEAATANSLISPKHFEQFAFPYLMEVHEKIHSLGYSHVYCHICGEQNANLPYWSQMHFGDPGIISIGHEIELETAAEHFPKDIILGNLEPATIQAGTPEEVYQATKNNIERGKKLPGGYIFSPGCELPPMAPVDNVLAMTQAINDFGWYI